MSLAPGGLQASVGQPVTSTHSFLSKEEQAYFAAREYDKAFKRLRQEEELKRRVKEERKRVKKANKAKAKAQAKGHTLAPKTKKSKAQRLKTFLKVKIFRRRSRLHDL